MATAYKCDISGQLVEGDGVTGFEFNVSETCRIKVIPIQRKNLKPFANGTICPAEADKIKKTVCELYGYVEPVADIVK